MVHRAGDPAPVWDVAAYRGAKRARVSIEGGLVILSIIDPVQRMAERVELDPLGARILANAAEAAALTIEREGPP
jgi:hypothetical protein